MNECPSHHLRALGTLSIFFFFAVAGIADSHKLVNLTKVPCSSQYSLAPNHDANGCFPRTNCQRVLMEDFVTPKEVHQLKRIADKGIEAVSSGDTIFHTAGPTIVDLNSGYGESSFVGRMHV